MWSTMKSNGKIDSSSERPTTASNWKSIGWACLCSTLLLIAAGRAQFSTAAANQQSGENPATLTLIAEIRALRQSLDNLAGNSVRLQLALERWRIQQALTDRAAEELRSLQGQLEGERTGLQQTEQSARQYEKLLAAEADPAQRNVYDRELQAALASIEQSKQRIQRLQEHEIRAHAALQGEQAKTQELTESLELLERAFNQSTPKKR